MLYSSVDIMFIISEQHAVSRIKNNNTLHMSFIDSESSVCDCDTPLKVFSLPDQIYSMSKKTPGIVIKYSTKEVYSVRG